MKTGLSYRFRVFCLWLQIQYLCDMKFAYLILAHNNFKTLARLVEQLDDRRNDIYIHLDRKVRCLPEISTSQAGLYFVSNRIDVRWGTVSQIEAIFALIKEARAGGEYDYYNIISGTHLSLKSQDFIHAHFETLNGASALGLWEPDEGDADFKLRRIHFGINNFQSPNLRLRLAVQRLWTLNMFIQKMLRVRIHKKCSFIKANTWAAVSKDAVAYLLEHEKEIIRKYRFSFCGDEYYLASELSGRFPIVDDRVLLFVKFENDHPFTLTEDDYSKLIITEYLFARKFED